MNNRKRTKNRYIKKQLSYLENAFIKGLANIPNGFSISTEIDDFDNGIMTVRVSIHSKQPLVRQIYTFKEECL